MILYTDYRAYGGPWKLLEIALLECTSCLHEFVLVVVVEERDDDVEQDQVDDSHEYDEVQAGAPGRGVDRHHDVRVVRGGQTHEEVVHRIGKATEVRRPWRILISLCRC